MTRLIDANALKIAEFIACRNDYAKGWNDAVEAIVKNAPTVDAEPVRHGKFIGTESDGYADGYPVYYEWKCSECGCIFEEDEPTYRYCPNCGCRMDKDE